MKIWLLLGLLAAMSGAAQAGTVRSDIYNTANGKKIGRITLTDTPVGLLIIPQLVNLPPGPHGFHLHQHADCGSKGMDAGGHFDPQKTGTHQGPYGQGHLGDLPVLIVTADHKATIPTLAPRLKTSDLTGLAIMIHAGGDNYSDNPPLGGGGGRIACGAIKVENH